MACYSAKFSGHGRNMRLVIQYDSIFVTLTAIITVTLHQPFHLLSDFIMFVFKTEFTCLNR